MGRVSESVFDYRRRIEPNSTILQPDCCKFSTNQNGEGYVALFLGLLGKLSRVDTIQSILVLIDDFLQDRPDGVHLFLSYGTTDLNNVFGPFLK
jgi:hypothetical protein